jgi:glycosyl hydrolase family 26
VLSVIFVLGAFIADRPSSIALAASDDLKPTTSMFAHTNRIDQASAGGLALGLYRPSFPDDLSVADENDRATGGRLDIVHWYALWGGWKRDFNRDDLERVRVRGSLPMITWEPWAGRDDDPNWTIRAAILSGANDEYIESWARGLAEYGQPLLLRFAHEMHERPYPWAVGVNGNTADDYVQAWRHVRTIFDRYPTSNVQWVWNPNAFGEWTASDYEPMYRSLYPGDELVDWLGIDVYNTGPGLDWGAPYWRSFRSVLAEPYEALTRISSKPILLPEVGCAELGGSKAAWIHEAVASDLPVAFPRVVGLVWFDVMKEERWALGSSSQALEAWRTAASQADSAR